MIDRRADVGLLDGKVAVVTGGGRGLGSSHAMILAEHGAQVVVADPGYELDSREPNPEVAEVVVKEIESAGGVAVASAVDVSTPTAGAQLVSEALHAFGRLDILVNNAGAFHDAVFEEIDERTFAEGWAVHVTATVRTTAAVFPVMASQGGGVILNTGSSFWAPRSPGFASYSPAKGAIFSFTRSAAAEGASSGIRVNTLIPLAATRASQKWLSAAGWFHPDKSEEWHRLSPRWSSVLVLGLVSPLSDGITGRAFQVVPTDGVREIVVEGTSRHVQGEVGSPELSSALAELALSHAGRQP